MPDNLPVIRVNEIGEFIRHQCCARRFKLEIDNRSEARRLPFFQRLFNPLDPVLQEEGRKREDQWSDLLREEGLAQLDNPNDEDPREFSWPDFMQAVSAIDQGTPAFAREVSISGQIGAFELRGRMDFVLVLWDGEQPYLRIVECKASRKDRTYHRIQVGIYQRLVKSALTGDELTIGQRVLQPSGVQAVVARIDESTNTLQSILGLPSLPLEMELSDTLSLLAEDGPLVAYASADLDDLDYQISQKCDTCVFNTDCLPESALHRRPQVIGIAPSVVRTLARYGVNSIDDLANVDPDGDTANQLRSDAGFSESIESLVTRARARRKNLPGAEQDGYEVEAIPNTGFGSLPTHEINGRRLVRIFLAVDYDYAENRIGSLSAHVTSSDHLIKAGFIQEERRWVPYPRLVEAPPDWDRNEGPQVEELPDVRGTNIVRFKNSPWRGRYDEDTSVEADLIEGFLNELVDAIDDHAEHDEVPIHFYVWSRSEIGRLVEACARTDTELLGHLRHLLGCRESLEQLIFSSLQDEAYRRYGLGWTGRGLCVATSLRWFGEVYHWKRRVGRREVDLDRAFTQDLFDFKTTLGVGPDSQWMDSDDPNAARELFEIRSRFYDQLPAPYWRAVWRELPEPDQVRDAKVRNAIIRYNEAGRPNYLREYLNARTQALRWIEERIRPKNAEITKEFLSVAELRGFRLTTRDLGEACIEFLRLDQHVKASDWVARHLLPPRARVSNFQSLPIRDVRESEQNSVFSATLDAEGYGTTPEVLSENCSIGEGSFVRLTPRPDGAEEGQSIGLLQRLGSTCVVDQLNWETGEVTLTALFQANADRYRLGSLSSLMDPDIYRNALLDESPSGYTECRVDRRLTTRLGSHVFRWLDPTQPQIPELPAVDPANQAIADQVLAAIGIDESGILVESQVDAIRDSIATRVHLLQGPPGTGKTRTSAISLLVHAMVFCRPGDVILVGGSTHNAVDTLLQRVAEFRHAIEEIVRAAGGNPPDLSLFRIIKRNGPPPGIDGVQGHDPIRTTPYSQAVRGSVLIVAGTTSGLLTLSESLDNAARFPTQNGSFAKTVFVDEASMMKLPDFLSLASLGLPDCRLMLTGDHRQLAPIIAHDWQNEDRPPTVLYKPYVSAYDAVHQIALQGRLPRQSVCYSALTFTFRLPPEIRELISRIYRLDDIELLGSDCVEAERNLEGTVLDRIWSREFGVYLLLHDERESRRSNRLEAQVIRSLLQGEGAIPDDSVAIITPHRAQRGLLREMLGDLSSVSMIDTVERLQGGERPTVIVSATASDPSAISASAEFLLNLNRANVAFSRAQARLIVVCSRALLEHVPAELEKYESALLWKALRNYCERRTGLLTVNGHDVLVFEPPIPE